jgi:hypothetical protein
MRSEVLHRVKEDRNIVHTVNRRKADWIGHILCRNCLLRYIIRGKIERRIEVTGRQGKKKQLLDDLEEKQDTGNGGSTRLECMANCLRKGLMARYKNN